MSLRLFPFTSVLHDSAPPQTWAAACLAALLLCMASPGKVHAQAATAAPKIPPPLEMQLKDRTGKLLSKEGVELHATYYPGTKGTESVAVLLVHMWEGKRSDWSQLALYLQKQGYAVLAPDLRGHGDSTTRYVQGKEAKLEPAKFRPADFDSMVTDDLEACKSFLMQENNAGKLNIDKLCVVGAEMGAVVATNWAVVDWSWPVLATGKQGQDVKALVLLSPIRKVEKGTLLMSKPARHPAVREQLSILIMYGNKGKADFRKDADQFYTALEPYHKHKSQEEQDLFLVEVNTALQGTKMLSVPTLKMEEKIHYFIEERVAKRGSAWRDRSAIGP